MAALTDQDKVAQMGPDLRLLLESEGVTVPVMVKLYDLGFKTLRLFQKFDSTEERVKEGFKRDLEIDPAASAQNRIEMARLLACWEQASKRVETRNKLDAEAAVQGLPPS